MSTHTNVWPRLALVTPRTARKLKLKRIPASSRNPFLLFEYVLPAYGLGGGGTGAGAGWPRYASRSTWLALNHSASLPGWLWYLLCMIASSVVTNCVPS